MATTLPPITLLDGRTLFILTGENGTVTGTSGNDIFVMASGNQTIDGGGGNDLYFYDLESESDFGSDVLVDDTSAFNGNDRIFVFGDSVDNDIGFGATEGDGQNALEKFREAYRVAPGPNGAERFDFSASGSFENMTGTLLLEGVPDDELLVNFGEFGQPVDGRWQTTVGPVQVPGTPGDTDPGPGVAWSYQTLDLSLFFVPPIFNISAGYPIAAQDSVIGTAVASATLGDVLVEKTPLTRSAGLSVTTAAAPTGTRAADELMGTNGDDTIDGRNGNDFLVDFGGNDVLNGGNGDDVIVDLAGADRLNGGNGNDRLGAGEGSDILRGGAGRDEMLGGADSDRFIFTPGDAADQGRLTNASVDGLMIEDVGDVIFDFTPGEDRLVFKQGLAADRVENFDINQDGTTDSLIVFEDNQGTLALLGISVNIDELFT